MVLCSGCFDGLHAGHVRYLHEAHALSPQDALVVAIAPDDYIRTTKQRAPFWGQAERAQTVLALGVVDRVIYQRASTPAGLIREYRPHAFVKGADWTHRLPEDVIEACRDVGCRIVFTDPPGTHTSEARG